MLMLFFCDSLQKHRNKSYYHSIFTYKKKKLFLLFPKRELAKLYLACCSGFDLKYRLLTDFQLTALRQFRSTHYTSWMLKVLLHLKLAEEP